MNLQSQLGYKTGPFQDSPINNIRGGSITMQGVPFPVVGTDGKTVKTMMPGNNYKFGGNVTEMKESDLDRMEPVLLEAHLKSLAPKQQKKFMDIYDSIDDKLVKDEVLKQIFKKHHKSVSEIFAQDGVLVDDPLQPSYQTVNQRPYLSIDQYEAAGMTYMGTQINSPNKSNTVDMKRFPQGPQSDPNWDPSAQSPAPTASAKPNTTQKPKTPQKPAAQTAQNTQVPQPRKIVLTPARTTDVPDPRDPNGGLDPTKTYLSVPVQQTNTSGVIDAFSGRGTPTVTFMAQDRSHSGSTFRAQPKLTGKGDPNASFDNQSGEIMYNTPYGKARLGKAGTMKLVSGTRNDLYYDESSDQFQQIRPNPKIPGGYAVSTMMETNGTNNLRNRVEGMVPGAYDNLKKARPVYESVTDATGEYTPLQTNSKIYSRVQRDNNTGKFYGFHYNRRKWVQLDSNYVKELAPEQYKKATKR